MQTREQYRTLPDFEQLTLLPEAAGQRDMLGNIPLFQYIRMQLETLAEDCTDSGFARDSHVQWTLHTPAGSRLNLVVDAEAKRAVRQAIETGPYPQTVHVLARRTRPLEGQPVFAEGSVVRHVGEFAHVDVQVTDEKGILAARGWCVLKLTDASNSNATEDRDSDTDPPTAQSDCELFEGGLGI